MMMLSVLIILLGATFLGLWVYLSIPNDACPRCGEHKYTQAGSDAERIYICGHSKSGGICGGPV